MPDVRQHKTVTERNLVVKGVSISALMQRRAHDQFASVKAGSGPLAPGQMYTRKNQNDTQALHSRPKVVTNQGLRSEISCEKISSSETSHHTMPIRSLRAKVSLADIRVHDNRRNQTSSSCGSRESGPVKQNHHNHIQPQDSSSIRPAARSHEQPALGKPGPAADKRSLIAKSVVMQAMVQSRIPQKTIKDSTAKVAVRPISSIAAGTGFNGSGIKVKGMNTGSPVLDTMPNSQQRQANTTQQRLSAIKAKTTRTPTISPSEYSVSSNRSLRNVKEHFYPQRPVTIKSP